MMFFIQFAIVLICILIGARIGGIGLGILGGLGLAILTFGFQLAPANVPIDVMLMIISVVVAASCMQAAGGLNYLVQIAEKILRKNPKNITFIAPITTFLFTIFAGTGHIAYSVLPVIAEVSRHTGIRPERPLSMAVLASQFAIVASPISAAVVTLTNFLEPHNISMMQILGITLPATILGLAITAIIINKMGKELKDDPEYQRRLSDPDYQETLAAHSTTCCSEPVTPCAKLSVLLFFIGIITVVLLGAFPSLRPAIDNVPMSMAASIEIVMLSVGAVIVMICKPSVPAITQGNVFNAGMRAVIAIFGIAWLGDTLFNAHLEEIKMVVQNIVASAPWTFAITLFVFSIIVNSQGATITVLAPLALGLGISPYYLIAMFPAVNGYFFIPNYGPIIAAIDFDETGTTKIGKYIFNHSFMIPGLITTITSIVFGFLFMKIIF